MPFVQRNGLRVHYLDAGRGPPVVLLHAFPVSGELFRPQVDALSARYRLLVPDFRGFGQSELGAPEPSLPPSLMSTLAADVLAVMDDAKVGAAVVGGVSMGGYVTMALLALAPGRVKALVLADTHARADDDATRARREETARTVLDKGMGSLAEAMVPLLLSPGAPPAVVSEVRRLILEQSPQAAAAAARGMAARPDSREVLKRFDGPALVVHGELDAIASRERHEEMAALLQGSRRVAIPTAGHLANLEAPSELNRTLEEFLATAGR